MPVLDRQPVPERLDPRRAAPPQRIPESRPTPLQAAFIPLSVVALLGGVVAISALELGSSFTAPVVRLPAAIGAAILVVVSVDALVRVWRSAWAWLPVDRGRGLFRFVWSAVIALAVVVLAAIAVAAVVGIA